MFGVAVVCSDGSCGRFERAVLDPQSWVCTHLVVTPDNPDEKRLVPIELAVPAGKGIRLRCDRHAFEALEAAEYIRQPNLGPPVPGIDPSSTVPAPGLDGMAGSFGSAMGVNSYPAEPVITDRVPVGDVELYWGDHVHATDGVLGRAAGLVVAPDSRILFLVVEVGHLWAKQNLRVPIRAVSGYDDAGVQLSVRKSGANVPRGTGE